MKKSFILLSSLLFACSSQAQPLSFDKLFEITPNNFCYQHNKESVSGINKFFKVNSNYNNHYLLGNKPIISMNVMEPVLQINETEKHLKEVLAKFDPNRFTHYDLENNRIKNIYTLIFKTNIEVALTPIQTISMLGQNFRGINFDSDKYAGNFVFEHGVRTDFNNAKSVKDFSQKMEKIPSAAYSFVVTPSSQNTSVITYQCQMTVVSDKTPNSFGIDIVD